MSYYLVLVSPRDIPLYEADLYSKPPTASSSSFFSSSSSHNNAAANANAAGAGASNSPRPSIDSFSSGGGGGGVFGFGSALRDLTSGLNLASAPANPNTATTAAARQKGIGFARYNDKHVLQMIAHSSLDLVEDCAVGASTMYLKQVDRINEWSTSCFLVPGGVKFLILHEHKHDDGIRNFFLDVWEAYLKVSMNPFHDINTPITSPSFDSRVKASARKHL
ncbi:TRAPP subunit [Thecaphora frezii]